VRCGLAALLALALARSAGAQTVAARLARGDSLARALEPAAALAEYRAALALDSTSYDALWKSAEATVDVAKQLTSPAEGAHRDSLYLAARHYAEGALRVDSLAAQGHFELAQALGRYARTRSGPDRVRYGRIIYDEAARALALDPQHDGAEHVLGAWHAEVMRLSGATRFLARTLFGAQFLSRASWDSATAHLERAVQLRPTFIYHRLELARVYIDRHRYVAAHEQLERIATLPVQDVSDPAYKQQSARLLQTLPSDSSGGPPARPKAPA
jgi:tetratricopeptide (TPR) repeat protein